MLQILYGTVGTGKTAELYRRLEEHIKSGTRAYILVPEQFSMETERSVITKLGVSAQTQIEVLTFSRLCNLVLSRRGPLRMQYVDSAGKLLLARRALQACEKELGQLSANVQQRGFAEILVSTISECKRYGVTPEQLKRAAEQTDRDELKRKLADIALLYETYQKLMSERFSDAEDNLSLILPKLADCDFLQGSLYIQHFKSFTPVELSAVAGIMKRMDVIFLADCDDLSAEVGVFAAVATTVRQLRQQAEREGIAVAPPLAFTQECKFAQNPALLHLKCEFFQPSPQSYEEEQRSVYLLAPRNYDREVTECARTIVRLCRTEGYRMQDFLVLARSVENYLPLINATFPLYDIPVFIDCKHSIARNPLIRFLSGLLDCLSYGLNIERIMTMARTGLFPLTWDEVDVFENYVLAAGVNHAMWNSKDAWSYNPDVDQFDLEIVNRVRECLMTPVRLMTDACRGRKTVSDICTALLVCMEQCKLSESVSALCADFLANGKPAVAEEYRQVWNANLSLIAQINDTLGSEAITFVKFTEWYNAMCAAVEVGTVPAAIDQVTVSEIDRFRNADAKVVFVLGVNEGSFPKSITQEGILSDRDREELHGRGIELAPSLFAKAQEEQTLIYRVLTAPQDKLYLSCPSADKDGNGLVPSEIITKIKKELFPNISVYVPDEDTEALPEGRRPALDELAVRLSECGGNCSALPPVWQQIYYYYWDQEDTRPVLEHLQTVRERKGAPEQLTLRQVKQLYEEPLRLSVTKLEKYNECAFAFFMRYGLVINPRLESGFAANSMGFVLHEVLSEYFASIQQQKINYADITKESCVAQVEALTENSAQKSEKILYHTSFYYKYMVMRMKGIASATAWEIVKFYRQSQFRPAGFEIRIGDGGVVPPVKLTPSRGEAVVNGFIDRADMAEIDGQKYISILDYKSSDKNMNEELANAGIRIQPLIYAKAMCEQEPNAAPAAVLYMKMDDPIVSADTTPSEEELDSKRHDEIRIKGWVVGDETVAAAFESGDGTDKFLPNTKGSVLDKEDFSNKIESAYRKITLSAEEILEGNIAAEPYVSKAHDSCAYCDYSSICLWKDSPDKKKRSDDSVQGQN
uniref:ATP-dependent helicase/deoxyribonuclease subunit B n=1 Tax=uncultured Bacillota bacterium TaxID=344338 RepID=A0A650F4J0_9FIRM|nr:ATP-dependent helicase/deoxyribonuclease subunit B [uncultured Firmicutes bacterium]